METNTKRLHPLLTIAAISVTLFSAVGVAAITGVIPHSKGSDEPAVVAATPAPAPEAAPVPMPEAAPAPQPVKKPVAKKHTPAKVAVAETPALTPPPPAVEIQRPVVKPGLFGTVAAVREVEVKGDANGVGAVGGGVAGAVLGHNIGDHNKLVTVLGAAGGGLLGNQIEKQARTEKVWEMSVRYDDGSTQTFQSKEQPFWHQGDHVRLYEGKLQPV